MSENVDDVEALQRAFLHVNAKSGRIADEAAQLIRDLMRAASSETDDGYKSAQQMERLVQWMTHCSEPLSWHGIFSNALDVLRDNRRNSNDSDYLEVSRRGARYLVERSANDPAARGRSAKCLSELQHAISDLESAKGRARFAPSDAQQAASDEMDLNARNLGKRS